ncbi:hypothetical protein BDAP_000107 [Binucleata daphniae]
MNEDQKILNNEIKERVNNRIQEYEKNILLEVLKDFTRLENEFNEIFNYNDFESNDDIFNEEQLHNCHDQSCLVGIYKSKPISEKLCCVELCKVRHIMVLSHVVAYARQKKTEYFVTKMINCGQMYGLQFQHKVLQHKCCQFSSLLHEMSKREQTNNVENNNDINAFLSLLRAAVSKLNVYKVRMLSKIKLNADTKEHTVVEDVVQNREVIDNLLNDERFDLCFDILHEHCKIANSTEPFYDLAQKDDDYEDIDTKLNVNSVDKKFAKQIVAFRKSLYYMLTQEENLYVYCEYMLKISLLFYQIIGKNDVKNYLNVKNLYVYNKKGKDSQFDIFYSESLGFDMTYLFFCEKTSKNDINTDANMILSYKKFIEIRIIALQKLITYYKHIKMEQIISKVIAEHQINKYR